MNHRRQQRRHSELSAAAQQLRDYGFDDEDALCDALVKHGTDVKKCVKHLMQKERDESACTSSSETSTPTHSTRSGASSNAETADDSLKAHTESEAASASSALASSGSASSGPASSGSASETKEVEHGPGDWAAIAACRSMTEDVGNEMQSLASKYEPRVLIRQWHKCKLHVSRVPLELVAYEEALLKLQMSLDMIAVGDEASEEAMQEVRGMRRAKVRAIQDRLDDIDQTRMWWLDQPDDAPDPLGLA